MTDQSETTTLSKVVMVETSGDGELHFNAMLPETVETRSLAAALNKTADAFAAFPEDDRNMQGCRIAFHGHVTLLETSDNGDMQVKEVILQAAVKAREMLDQVEGSEALVQDARTALGELEAAANKYTVDDAAKGRIVIVLKVEGPVRLLKKLSMTLTQKSRRLLANIMFILEAAGFRRSHQSEVEPGDTVVFYDELSDEPALEVPRAAPDMPYSEVDQPKEDGK